MKRRDLPWRQQPKEKCDIVTEIFIEGGRTLLGDEILETSLRVAGQKIGPISIGHGRGSLELDAAISWCCRASSICIATRSSGR
jgi:hypothetical protein